MTVQPCPQLGAFSFLAASFAGTVVEGADEFGDRFAHRTAGQFGDGLFHAGQRYGGARVRQTVQAEEVCEGLALGVVERSEAHPCDGAAGGQAIVQGVPERAEFGAAQGAFARGGFRVGHPASRSMPFQTKRALVTASSSPSVRSWWTAMPGSSP